MKNSSKFLKKIFDNILDEIYEKKCQNENDFIYYLDSLIDKRTYIEATKKQDYEILLKNPLLHSFYEKSPIPLLKDNKIEYMTIKEILELENVILYECETSDFQKEIDLAKHKLSYPIIAFIPIRTTIFLS